MRGKAANVKKNLPGALRTIVQDHFKKRKKVCLLGSTV